MPIVATARDVSDRAGPGACRTVHAARAGTGRDGASTAAARARGDGRRRARGRPEASPCTHDEQRGGDTSYRRHSLRSATRPERRTRAAILSRMETIGKLVAAAIVDERVWQTQGDMAPDGVYLTGQPGPALPFVLYRAWKVGVGIVEEEVRMYGPSGRMVWRWGPVPRRMNGMFDLTTEIDLVPNGVFDETGTYVASFILDGQVVGEIELPVYVQAGAAEAAEGDRGRAEALGRDLGGGGGRRPPAADPRVVRVQGRQDLRVIAARAGSAGADGSRHRPGEGVHRHDAAQGSRHVPRRVHGGGPAPAKAPNGRRWLRRSSTSGSRGSVRPPIRWRGGAARRTSSS